MELPLATGPEETGADRALESTLGAAAQVTQCVLAVADGRHRRGRMALNRAKKTPNRARRAIVMPPVDVPLLANIPLDFSRNRHAKYLGARNWRINSGLEN